MCTFGILLLLQSVCLCVRGYILRNEILFPWILIPNITNNNKIELASYESDVQIETNCKKKIVIIRKCFHDIMTPIDDLFMNLFYLLLYSRQLKTKDCI